MTSRYRRLVPIDTAAMATSVVYPVTLRWQRAHPTQRCCHGNKRLESGDVNQFGWTWFGVFDVAWRHVIMTSRYSGRDVVRCDVTLSLRPFQRWRDVYEGWRHRIGVSQHCEWRHTKSISTWHVWLSDKRCIFVFRSKRRSIIFLISDTIKTLDVRAIRNTKSEMNERSSTSFSIDHWFTWSETNCYCSRLVVYQIENIFDIKNTLKHRIENKKKIDGIS